MIFIILLISIGSVQAQESKVSSQLGQTRMRTELQKLLNTGAELEEFKARHFFTDIAELSSLAELKQKPLHETPSESAALLKDFRNTFSAQPYRVDRWLRSLLVWTAQFLERPYEGIATSLKLLHQFYPPLLLALFLALIIHLFGWLPALQLVFMKYFKTASPGVLYATIFSLLIASMSFQTWGLNLVFLLCCSILYSWRAKAHIALAALACVGISFSLFSPNIQMSLEEAQPIEALIHGRNKLEYSAHAVKEMPAEYKAVWAYWNEDIPGALAWADRAPSSASAKILKANLQYSPARLDSAVRSYEELIREHPEDAVIRYNLSQLYTSKQELIKAEQARDKISKDIYTKLAQRAERTKTNLVQPIPTDVNQVFFQRLLKRLNEGVVDLGLGWVAFLLIWTLLAGAIYLRRFSYGMCIHSGEATKSIYDTSTALAESVLQKSENLEPTMRQQFIAKTRGYEQLKIYRGLRWSWIFPASADIIEGRFGRGVLFGFISYCLIWLSLPFEWRSNIIAYLGGPKLWLVPGSDFSWPLFGLGAAVYIWILIRSRRALNS